MTRVVVLALTALTAILAAACGSGSSHPVGPPAEVIRQGDAAVARARSASFRLDLRLTLSGSVPGLGGAGAALGQGPLALAMRGQAGRGGRFDAQFALRYSGGSLTGSLLSADGRTGYLRLPALFGPGWHSFAIPATAGATAGSGGLDPLRWLRDGRASSGGGQDAVSAALDVPAMIANVASSSVPHAAADAAELRRFGRAIRTATFSISYDSSTHLPSRVTGRLDVSLPAGMAGVRGLHGFALTLNLALSRWNEGFTVTPPAGSTPLSGGALGL
jgi:hypothetical protein